MTTKSLFCLVDTLVPSYDNILISDTKDTMKRQLQATIINNKDSLISLYPQNFELYYIGQVDVETGDVIAFQNGKVKICNLDSLV